MPKKYPYLEEFFKDINLDNKQKIKLIELMLLISSILTAFKLPDNLIEAFMLFLLFSIFYWIILQKDVIRTINSISTVLKYLLPPIISFFFVFILFSVKFINPSASITTISDILFIIYYIAFFSVIWIALSPDFNYVLKNK